MWPRRPRAVTPPQARDIISGLPAFVTAVGVFVNQPEEDVFDTVVRARLTAIQLHGDEDASQFARSPVPVIKALPVGPGFTMAAVDDLSPDVTALLDAHDPVRRGGTGRPIEWTVAAAAARRRPIILSGGLTPDNVERAIREVRPYAIDVSSGVETAPGIKDESKLRALFGALQSASVLQP
jgi:phosphoribosylanthranilate isomerase